MRWAFKKGMFRVFQELGASVEDNYHFLLLNRAKRDVFLGQFEKMGNREQEPFMESVLLCSLVYFLGFDAKNWSGFKAIAVLPP